MMLTNYLLAILLVLVFLIGWCTVQQLARFYAKQHPEFGPTREEGGGCGMSCGCSDPSACQNKNHG
jgi:hypothetical protein